MSSVSPAAQPRQSITVKPDTRLERGETITVVGRDWGVAEFSSERVRLFLGGERVGVAHRDGDGSFRARIEVPKDAKLGVDQIVARQTLESGMDGSTFQIRDGQRVRVVRG